MKVVSGSFLPLRGGYMDGWMDGWRDGFCFLGDCDFGVGGGIVELGC